MQNSLSHFEGVLELRLNRQFRVKLPQEWCADLAGALRLALRAHDGLPTVEILTEKTYLARLAEIDGMAGVSASEKQAAMDAFVSKCRMTALENRRRLTVPADWCEAAGLAAGGEIVLAGRGKTLECWNTGNFHTMVERETLLPDF